MPLFAGIFSSNLKILRENEADFRSKSALLSRDRTIETAFKNFCRKKGDFADEAGQFCSEFESLFAGTSVQIEVLGIKDGKKLLKCSWKSGGNENFILAIYEKAD